MACSVTSDLKEQINMSNSRRVEIDRRQFLNRAGWMTGISLGTLGEPVDLGSLTGGSLGERKILDQDKSRLRKSDKKQRRIILSEDGTWWLGGDGRLTRRHLERFVEEAAGVVDTLAPVMDYSFQEVRDHRFAILRELVERYDWDGLELDFTRNPYLFPSHVAEERAPVMTKYIRQIRDLLDSEGRKKGKGRLVLGVRVPHELELCKKRGMDVPVWVREGLLDYLCPGSWLWAEFDMKVEDFKALTDGTSCGLYPSIQPYSTRRDKGSMITREMCRAAAHNYYSWGADGINFYNLHRYNYSIPLSSDFDVHDPGGERSHMEVLDREMLKELRDPDVVSAKDRHYVFLPHDAMGGHDLYSYRHTHMATLKARELGKRQVFPFRMAEDLRDSKLEGKLRFKAVNQTIDDQIEIDLNRRPLPMNGFKKTYHWRGVSEWGVLPPYYRYEMSISGPLARRGDNELGATLVKKNHQLEGLDIDIVDIEVVVKSRQKI